MNQESIRSSWAESSVHSKRSTQISFASSRTSLCSGFSDASYGPQEMHPQYYQEAFTPVYPMHSARSSIAESSVSDLPATGQNTSRRSSSKGTLETTQGRCPWCATTFTRRHDFKKHAREFHLSRLFWQCRSPSCKERIGSERQAKLHPNRTRSVDCKNLGSAKVELRRDRQHFGCPHCARYFSDAEVYLTHLAHECSPAKAPRSAHQSLQVRALFDQPEMIDLVRSVCLQWRGYAEAYRKLWWTWNKSFMADIIERLEYGVHGHVDAQHPGIASHALEGFLQDMLAPSSGSMLEADIASAHLPQQRPMQQEKPLPPLPMADVSPVAVQYHRDSVFDQTRSFLHPVSEQPQSEPYPYPSTVEEWRVQQLPYDPMAAVPVSETFDALQAFQWNPLVEDMNMEVNQDQQFNGQGFT